jgi:hypothetical protein
MPKIICSRRQDTTDATISDAKNLINLLRVFDKERITIIMAISDNTSRYSNVIITDDNFDEELEKLCDVIDMPYGRYETFTEKLDDGFTKQKNEHGFDEWIKSSIVNRSAGISEATQTGQLAYEFGNGFVVLNFETII